jgi:hypothetical protein
MITNDVSDYINLFVRIAHIICNHTVYVLVYNKIFDSFTMSIRKVRVCLANIVGVDLTVSMNVRFQYGPHIHEL